nr:MAG TPA: hypothetical protein [Bacteriophage sp.]DAZ10875.1 MAG TPA: hypothetical protein [Caudoviricetes sp.]
MLSTFKVLYILHTIYILITIPARIKLLNYILQKKGEYI